jgi:hypothetical protein
MKVYWNMNLGVQVSCLQMQNVDTSKKKVVAETLNPKK